ncbi:MAG: type II toxin-antitoxin system RelE/ParE family toxin [Legionella sp.]|nr:type II toxin-antitoxin system RelE/ParE family toxin [Legionella sp.]
MTWEVTFYSEKVMKNVLQWPAGIKAKFIHIMNLIEKYGPVDVGMPFVKSMGDGLFEIRAKGKEGIGRAFFCSIKEKRVIVLHEIIKKTQKTPTKELKIARKRLSEVKND